MLIYSDSQWPPRRCSGDCSQGRRECSTPDACELPEPADKMLSSYRRGIVSALLVLAIAAFVAVVKQ